MKLRIKYTKTGVLRFISHLDVMRYFQKTIRRAKLDITYTKGFSPHQVISFAAPMPLGMTSLGEYCDAEFDSVTTTEDMMKRFNAQSTQDLLITDIVLLPDDTKPSMAQVAASDYVVTFSDEGREKAELKKLFSEVCDFDSAEALTVLKKTKKSEAYTDIKPLIYEIKLNQCEDAACGIYMLLAAGSVSNLKPELVMEALCSRAGLKYDRFDYQIMRLETYMEGESGFLPLSAAGERIL